MTKFFCLLFCFLHPLRGAKDSRLWQENFSSRLLPTDTVSEIVGSCLAENLDGSENRASSLRSFLLSLAYPQGEIYLEMLRYDELNSGFAISMFIIGSLYCFCQCPCDYITRYNYPSSSCPFLVQNGLNIFFKHNSAVLRKATWI